MPDDTNTDNDTICSSDDTIRSSECEHPLTSQLAKILAILPDRLISRGVEGVIAALHEVRHIERHCRNHPAAASVQAVELLDNAHRLDTIVQRYLGELSRATAKAQRDTAERELDAAKSILLESLGLDESTIEAAARLAAGAPLPSGHVDPTPNPLVVRLAEVLTGCPMSSTELAETRVTRAAAAILSWLADPKVPAVKLAPWLPSMPEDHDGEEAVRYTAALSQVAPKAAAEAPADAQTLANARRRDLAAALIVGDDEPWGKLVDRVKGMVKQHSLDRIQMEGALRSLHDREQFRFKMASAMDLPAMTSEVELVDIARQATIALRARSGDAKKPLLGIEHSKLLAILDPQGKHSLSLEDLYDLVVILAKAEAPASSNCFSDYEVAKLLHESGRPAAKAGQSVSGVTAFVGWSDLTCVVRAGRLWSARNLMNAAFVGDAPAPAGSTVLSREAVARAIHLAERTAIDRGWVLNPTGKPWIEFDDLGEAARAGRMRQAEALEIAKIALWVWDK